MSNTELKEAVIQANEALKAAIEAARAAGITVNLWINGTGPTGIGKSHVGLEFSE